MQKTKIPYATHTWNPVRGCSHKGVGCLNCYAERLAMRFCGERHEAGTIKPYAYHGYADEHGWTGKVSLIESELLAPWRKTKPARIFVSMGDVFHESLHSQDIDKIFAAMAIAPQHEYIILTKRPLRMRDYMRVLVDGKRAIASAATRMRGSIIGGLLVKCAHEGGRRQYHHPYDPWSFLNLGVSCSTQAEVDCDVPILLDTPAAKRALSLEPLIEAVIVRKEWLALLSVLIAGGESGPHARPYHVEWGESLLKQCRESGTAFYMKQQGSNAYTTSKRSGIARRIAFTDFSGSDPSEWPEADRVREWPVCT